jgi:hypothetical protein
MAKSVCVFCDFDEEIDDELAAWHLLTNTDFEVTFVVCKKTLKEQEVSLANWLELAELLELRQPANIFTLDAFRNIKTPQHFDGILQIAPLHGFSSTLVTCERYVLMGTPNNSVNSPKGRDPDLFDLQKGPLIVFSEDAAKIRPDQKLLDELPTILRDMVYETSFRLMLRRCPPELPIAEGLINKQVGRGANYTSVENLCGWRSPGCYFTENREVDEYCKNMKPETRIKLLCMMKALDDFFGQKIPVITPANYTEFRVSNQELFEKFKTLAKPSALNPIYDLTAARTLEFCIV